MGKTVSGIIATGLSIAAAIPGPQQPFAAAAMAVFAIASATILAPKAPKPEQAEQALKNPRPPRVSAYGEMRLFAAYIFFRNAASGVAADGYAFHDGRMDEVLGYYIGDDKVTLTMDTATAGIVNALDDGAYGGGHVAIEVHKGAATETVLAAIKTHFPEWGDDHRGDGVVTASVVWRPVKSKKYLEVYPNGQPALSLVGKWQLCPDPRVSDWANPATWTWTENAARHLLHYKIVREGVDIATKITPTLQYWIDAADDCDVPMDLKAGGVEPRYRSCVAHKHTDPHKIVVAALIATFDGWVSPRHDGALVVYGGRYADPDPADLIGPAEIVSFDWDGLRPDDSTAVNELTITYISKDHDYNTVDGQSWTDEADISARGQLLTQSLDAQVPSFPQARRLAKRLMSRTMARCRGSVTTNVAGRKIRGKRYIPLRIEEAGAVFYDGPAEITALTRNMATGGVTFSWVAVDPDIDAWDPATEEGEGAPVTEAAPRTPLPAPTVTSAVREYGQDSGVGTPGVVIRLTIDGPARDDVSWTVRTRPQDTSVWQTRQYDDLDTGAGIVIVTEFVAIDSTIEVDVAYQVGDGRLSPFSEIVEVEPTTTDLAPAPTTATTATGGTGEITVTWRNPASPNYGFTRVFIGTTDDFALATALTPDDAGGTLESRERTFTGIAAGSWYVWTQAFNAATVAVGAAPDRAAGAVVVGEGA